MLRKSRPLAMRCQRHEEMVRALLVAQLLGGEEVFNDFPLHWAFG